jgi:myo-inositol-1(or 4)-monophosphatase
MHPMLNIAVRAALGAGNVIIRNLGKLDALTVHSKSRNDFVSEVDTQAEREIINILRKAYPDHGILAEESGHHDGDEFQWIIDPLDGTTNFLHGFPQFAVSIALRQKGRLEQGSQQHLDTYLAMFRALFPETAGIRRAGSAALDLAYVASGRLDGFWEIGLNIWDMAAGVLLIQEAGGLSGDFNGGHDFLENGNLVAGNPKLFAEILKTIHPFVTDELRSK